MKLKINKEKLVQNINQRKKGIGGRLKGIAITNPCWAICCNCCGGGISYWLTTAMVSTSDGITNTPINTTLYNSTSYTTLPYTWISATAPTTITFATPYDEPPSAFTILLAGNGTYATVTAINGTGSFIGFTISGPPQSLSYAIIENLGHPYGQGSNCSVCQSCANYTPTTLTATISGIGVFTGGDAFTGCNFMDCPGGGGIGSYHASGTINGIYSLTQIPPTGLIGPAPCYQVLGAGSDGCQWGAFTGPITINTYTDASCVTPLNTYTTYFSILLDCETGGGWSISIRDFGDACSGGFNWSIFEDFTYYTVCFDGACSFGYGYNIPFTNGFANQLFAPNCYEMTTDGTIVLSFP